MALFGNLIKMGTKALGPIGTGWAALESKPAGSADEGAAIRDSANDQRLANSIYGMASGRAPMPGMPPPGGAPAGSPPFNPAGGGGGRFGRAAAAPAYDPNTDPALINARRTEAYANWQELNNLYHQMNSQVDAYGADRRTQLDGAYDNEFQNSEKQYSQANDQVNGAMTGRNIYDSSYRSNALDGNRNDYDTDTKRLTQSRDADYAQLGQVLASNKAQFSNRPEYQGGAYNDVSSLTTLRDQYKGGANDLRQKQFSLFTQGQLKGELDRITPAKSQVAGQLKGRIDALVKSNADPASQLGILKNYIGKLPKQEQDQWMNYYIGLTKPQAPAKVA